MDTSPFQGNLGGEYPYYIRMTRKEIGERYRERHGEKLRKYMRDYYKANRSKWARPPRQLELALTYPKTQAQLERKRQINRESMKRMYEANPDKFRGRSKTWRTNNLDLDGERQKKYRRKRRHKFRAYFQNRLDTDPNFKMAAILRGRLKKALKRGQKSGSAIDLLGCSIPEFWIYLASKFEEGMTRENHGSVWHLDHIMPCAIFDLTKPEHQKQCFHFSNLQPLFAVDNLRKGAKSKCQL